MYNPGNEDSANKARIARDNPEKHGMNIRLDPDATTLLMKLYGDAQSDSEAVYNALKELEEIGRRSKRERVIFVDKVDLVRIRKLRPPWMPLNEFIVEAVEVWKGVKTFYYLLSRFDGYIEKFMQYKGVGDSGLKKRRD